MVEVTRSLSSSSDEASDTPGILAVSIVNTSSSKSSPESDLLCQLIPHITGVVVEEQRDVLLYMINSAMRGLLK